MKIFIHTNHFFLPKNSPHIEFQSVYFLIRKLTYLESSFCILMLVLSAGTCRVTKDLMILKIQSGATSGIHFKEMVRSTLVQNIR